MHVVLDLLRFLAPAMVLDTSGNIKIQRKANCAMVALSGTSARSSSTACKPIS